MESRLQRIFLIRICATLLVLCGITTSLHAAEPKPEDLELEPLIVREPERRPVDVDALDNENFEIGAFAGIMQFEDFGSDTLVGIRAAYHVTEDFFVEAAYGQSRLGQTSFEELSGGAPLLTDDERDLSYYNVSVGWNIFPGEAFVGRWAFKGGLYLVGGAGSTDFGGDELFTINAGVGYRLAATDWLALHMTVRDHYFESDLLGSSEGKHNIEFSGSITIFF